MEKEEKYYVAVPSYLELWETLFVVFKALDKTFF